MDEQRMQAYVGLIEQLPGCPQGEEAALLQAHGELVDAGLVEVMGQYADWLESQGNGNAGWLRQFAAQLAQALGLEIATTPQGTDAARQFWLETLQLIVDKQGDPQQIYPVWAQQQAQFNPELLAVLPTVAAQVLAGDTEQRTFIAEVFFAFGNLIQQFPLGIRWLNLELGIAAYEQVLEVRTREAMPVEWATAQMNLALAYSDRIRGDRADNLEQAIAAYEQVLEVRTREAMPVEWATAQMNLAIAYKNRIRGDRADNLEQAIAAYEQVLEVMTREAMPVEWATAQMNLANAYSDRIRGDRADNLEQAIAAYEQVLEVRTREAMPVDWATAQMNLANAYSDRIRGDLADNLEQAIVQTSLEKAIAAYQASLEIFTPEVLPNDCRKSARNLATLLSDQQRWQEAEPMYQMALDAAEILYQSATLLDSKSGELRETADLPRRAAYALARADNRQKAVETLERGRARGLSESLDRDRVDLTQLQQTHPDLYGQYQEVALQLRNLESQQRDLSTSDQRHSLTPTDLRDTAATLRDQLSQTLIQIRQVEGYADFLAPPSFEDVRAALRPDNPLVYLATTPNGSMALIVTVDGIDVLWLDDLTETKLIDLLNQTWFAAYRQSQTNRQGWYDAIGTVTRQLWDTLMGPLVQKLQDSGLQRITLLPTGYLSLLPLHAAWTPDPSTPTGKRYALDDLHITYAPNAQSLIAARTISDRVQTNSILAIDEPHHRILDIQTGEYKPVSPLPSSSKEVESAISTFQNPSILRHDHATRAAVLDALPHTTILHCSCHGNANIQEPLKSGLAMTGDGEDAILSLKDIFALNLAESGGLRLAILSACETGLIGIENADEAISLPTGLLQAGVAAVIASLWSVSDLSTMMLLMRFYDYWRNESLEPATALRQAQLWIRDTTSQQKATYFKETNPDIFQSLILLNPDYFAHPFHWAAFSYVGV
ncbi:CHAT domain-containing protein [Leptothoe sp. PORK10 BA2]|uniref:CHAT domain-containing protein n=1 Tax=Leptothoe sp. PORK10 BA2 TaxID=3110254 RepID=UPI003FA3AE40